MEANLKRRICTALVVLPLLVSVVGWGPPVLFTALIFVMVSLALYEYFNMALPVHPLERRLGFLFGLAVALLAVLPEISDREVWVSVSLVVIFTAYVFVPGRLHEKVARLGWLLLGAFYIGFLMPHWIFLFRSPSGRSWVFFAFAVVATGDTVAYFAGKRFGVRKLAPEISPGKTWAGAWGYVLGAAVTGSVAWRFYFLDYPFLEIAGLAVAFAVLGQVGDLFESLLKRVFNVKDSSSLVPGHGGVLDRLDSMIFPAVFANAYLKVFHP